MFQPSSRAITYDKKKVDAEVERLKKLGYPPNFIEIVAINGTMCARPIGDRPETESK